MKAPVDPNKLRNYGKAKIEERLQWLPSANDIKGSVSVRIKSFQISFDRDWIATAPN